MSKELRIVSGWFLDLSGHKPQCAFMKETSCTPDCVACEIKESGLQQTATCLRGPFVFASIVDS